MITKNSSLLHDRNVLFVVQNVMNVVHIICVFMKLCVCALSGMCGGPLTGANVALPPY